jgi:hypothetical protein
VFADVVTLRSDRPEAIKIQLDNESDTAGLGGCAVYKVCKNKLLMILVTIQFCCKLCY